jgi:hypothetical protein
MADFNKASTVISIKGRMTRLGIDLEKYIEKITHYWDMTPMGFGFICKDYDSLMSALVMSSNFGSDTTLGGKLHSGVSFREINTQDSLHISLSRRPDPKSGATCSIHLDSVSPVAGRDTNSRTVNYNYGKVLQHVATDALHTPFIVPNSEQGIVFGIRF